MRVFKERGFTLIEMIMVIVITGIIAGIVATFIQAPVQGYVDSARRAELTDIADTAVRRMARDVRTAVPNSVNLISPTTLEFLPTLTGGRYRSDAGGTGDVLNFGVADGSFEIIGPAINLTSGVDYIVVGSTQSDAVPPYNETAAGVLRLYTGPTGAQTTVGFAATALPTWARLPSHRFDVVDGTQQAVTYACVGPLGVAAGNGTASLIRFSGYGFAHAWAGGAASVLASRVSNCVMTYGVPNQRFGLVTISLTLTSGGESVNLYNEIHVNNAP